MRKLLLCVALFAVLGWTNAIADNPIGILLDDQMLSCDVPPISENGRVLVPLRVISEALQARVEWDDSEQMAIVFNGRTACLLTVDNTNAVVIYEDETQIIELDVPPMLKDGRTLLPVRFFAEFFGCDVDWQPQDDQDLVIIRREGV